MDLTAPVTALSGVGESTAGKLQLLGIQSIFDLLYHVPFRYEDRSITSEIADLQAGETVTIIGKLENLKNVFTRRGKILQVGEIADNSGKIQVIWFNQSYLLKSLLPGQTYAWYGKVDVFNKKMGLIVPDYESITADKLHTGRIVPIYPETAGLTSKWIRSKIKIILDELEIREFLPEEFGLPLWINSLKTVHFPSDIDSIDTARKRLALDELVLLQLSAIKRRSDWKNTRLAHELNINAANVAKFIKLLPFTLTSSQNKVINEILIDLSHTKPMNRLLEGDVGSGKTVIAALAAYLASANGFQTLILAPTQILANQHYESFAKFLTPFDVKIGLVTGSTKQFDAETQVFVGTHALLGMKFSPEKVAMVVIDEQHRFGVAQRALAAASGQSPHILTMTATPIPRTIALTLYGDLELSILTDMPPGRLPVKTWLVPESKRESAYNWITEKLKTNNSQAFWICPFIDESETMQTVKAVTVEFQRLQRIFTEFSVGLLHGRMKSKDKDQILADFRNGKFDILVSTPVVEVGVDIPTATIMVIEAASRFGLAQLHQLRGRVGRSNQQAYCLLFSDTDTARLRALENCHSGLELAEIDLRLRGPGDVFGTAQHGTPGFKIANYTDVELISTARDYAQKALLWLPKLPLLRKLLEKDKIGLIQPN
jgi:ATP-dependent DNA helicase RecG